MASSDLGPQDRPHTDHHWAIWIAAGVATVQICLGTWQLYVALTPPWGISWPDVWIACGYFAAAMLCMLVGLFHHLVVQFLEWAFAPLIEHSRDVGFAAALVGAFVGLWFFVDRSESLSELFGRRRLMQWRDAVILAAFLVAIVAALAARSKGIRLTLHRLSGLAATLGVVALAVGAPVAVMHYADLTEFFKGQDELLKAVAASVGVLGVVYVLKMWFAALQKFMGQFSDQVFALMQGAAGRKPIRPTRRNARRPTYTPLPTRPSTTEAAVTRRSSPLPRRRKSDRSRRPSCSN